LSKELEGKWKPGGRGRPPIATRPHETLTEEEQEFELSDLYSSGGKWSVEDKVRAASAMMVTGSSLKASKLVGIPAATIRWWANQSSWWPELIKAVRKEKQDELDAVQTDVIHKSLDELNDRLDNGDEVITKDGDKVRKKLGGRDLAIIHGTLFDKRQLVRGDPTSKVGKSDTDAIEALAQRFEDFANQMQQSGSMAKPIEGEVIENGSE